ncbi:hypothetical protein RHSIM_Rhsim13G0023200 [Rhododendron simsii]|uniref:Uncharacterized protein n=1 Tax=Rhododendron simsii TaxID=118357 RepID=A0A834L4D2_RHOSS|nr:hypothetical protein RHSIM_Rhsim13G0023200 [Rhododendron simsii]
MIVRNDSKRIILDYFVDMEASCKRRIELLYCLSLFGRMIGSMKWCLLLRLPLFLSKPEHDYTVIVNDECELGVRERENRFLNLFHGHPEFAKSAIEEGAEEESNLTGMRVRPYFDVKLP